MTRSRTRLFISVCHLLSVLAVVSLAGSLGAQMTEAECRAAGRPWDTGICKCNDWSNHGGHSYRREGKPGGGGPTTPGGGGPVEGRAGGPTTPGSGPPPAEPESKSDSGPTTGFESNSAIHHETSRPGAYLAGMPGHHGALMGATWSYIPPGVLVKPTKKEEKDPPPGEDHGEVINCCCCCGSQHWSPTAAQGVSLPDVSHRYTRTSVSGTSATYTSDPGNSTIRAFKPAGQTPYYLEFLPDGTIVRYDQYLSGVGGGFGRHYRPVWIRDAFDNQWTYTYGAGSPSRLESIEYPSGVVEHWDWNPSWAGGQVYGIRVHYSDISQAGSTISGAITDANKQQLEWGLVFLATSNPPAADAAPFHKTNLFRTYHKKTPRLTVEATASTLYDESNTTTDYYVEEYEYVSVATRTLLHKVFEYRASTITGAGTRPGSANLVEQVDWGQPSGQPHPVMTKLKKRHGNYFEFTYNWNATLGYNDSTVVKEYFPDGTLDGTTETTWDSRSRPLTITETASTNADGRGTPRALDASNSALGALATSEPASVTTTYVYGAGACGCGSPTSVTDPSGRTATYTWDSVTGQMLSHTVPNPSTASGAPSTVTTTYEYTWDAADGALIGTPALPSKIIGPSITWDINRTWKSRLDSHGQKPFEVDAESSNVTRISGSPQKLTWSTVYAGDGTVDLHIDAAGVQTEFVERFGSGQPKKVVTGSAATEKVTDEFEYDGWGRLLQVRSQTTSASHALTTNFESTVDGYPTRTSSTIGGVLHEQLQYFDRWGFPAVVLTKNLGSDGTTPELFGATDTGREYLRREYHYDGNRMVRAYHDRRPVSAGSSAPLYDASDALLLRTDYEYRGDGALKTVKRANGSIDNFWVDGYGLLYKVETTDANDAGAVLRFKRFVNSGLEQVAEFRGDATTPLWTEIQRDAGSGAVIGLVTPDTPLDGPAPTGEPPGYTGTLNGLRLEFDLDSSGFVTEERAYEAGGSTTLLARRVTEFDEAHRVKRTIDHVVGGVGTSGETYESKTLYDQALVKETHRPDGVVVTYSHDTLGRLIATEDDLANPNEEIRAYFDNGRFLEESISSVWEDKRTGTDAYKSFVTGYTWDPLGRLLTRSNLGDGGGSVTPLTSTYTYFTAGGIESFTDPAGKVQRFVSDALGRGVEHVKVGSSTEVISMATYVDWTATGTDTSVTMEQVLPGAQANRETRTYRDHAGRTYIVQNPGAPTTLPTVGSPHQPFSTFVKFDAASRPQYVYDGDLLETRLYFNGAGQLLVRNLENAFPGSGSNVAVTVSATREIMNRNPLGQVTSSGVQQGASSHVAEWFDPDSVGRQHLERYLFGFGYAAFEDVVSSYDTATHYRDELAYSSGLELTFGHDAIGRLNSISMDVTGGGASRSLATFGHMGSTTIWRETDYSSTKVGHTDNTFDVHGRHSSKAHSSAYATLPTFEYKYDAASNLVKEKYQRASGVATKVGDRFVYDDFHRLEEAWLGLTATTMDFGNSDPLLPTLDTSSPPASGDYEEAVTYQMDNAGNREQVDSLVSGTTTVADYGTQEAADPQGPSNRYDEVDGAYLFYDKRGNLIADGVTVYSKNYFYDFRNRLTEVWQVVPNPNYQAQSSSSGSTTAARSQVLPATVQLVDVNSARVRASARIQDLSEFFRNPSRVSLSEPLYSGLLSGAGGTTAQSSSSGLESEPPFILQPVAFYVYDAYNRRVSRLLFDEQTQSYDVYLHTYDGWRECEELEPAVSSNTVKKQFVWGRGLDELICYLDENGATWAEYFVHGGGQESVMRLVDSSGGLVEGVDYDAYGNASYFDLTGTSATPTPGNRSTVGLEYAWKGHRVDAETGFVYMRNRYYSSRTGRFLSLDPIGTWGDRHSDGNGYSYAAYKPQTFADPLGEQSALAILVAGGNDADRLNVLAARARRRVTSNSLGGELIHIDPNTGVVTREIVPPDNGEFDIGAWGEPLDHGPPNPSLDDVRFQPVEISIVSHGQNPGPNHPLEGGAKILDKVVALIKESRPQGSPPITKLVDASCQGGLIGNLLNPGSVAVRLAKEFGVPVQAYSGLINIGQRRIEDGDIVVEPGGEFVSREYEPGFIGPRLP